MWGRLRQAFLLLLIMAPAHAGETEVRGFGQRLGLRDLDGFVAAVESIRTTGHLPEHWITKREAERLGWRPGSDLCATAPGHAMGGDRFGNRERRLPAAMGRSWSEADLDFACGRRGARRLIWSSDGLVYVTVDHYETFAEVPP